MIIGSAIVLFSVLSVGAQSYNHDADTNEFVFKPRIGLGMGMLGYRGELNEGLSGRNSLVSRWGHQLYANAPLNAYLTLQFGTVFGQVAAEQRTVSSNYNFKSRIRMGNVQLLYNFYPLLTNKARFHLSPFIGTGISSFEFLSKTDAKDAMGRPYYYWDDGSIMDRPQTALDAASAIRLQRDYTYETDLREQDLDGLGAYREQSFAIPITYGFNFHIGRRVDFRISSSYLFTFTDLIDNFSDEGVGVREGDKKNDKLLFTSFSLSYDLIGPKGSDVPKDFDENIPDDLYVWQDSTDTDGDGVIDMVDECAYTPLEADVNMKGCPLDTDKDGVPDYMDDEPYFTIQGAVVNERGVEITDEEWEKRYLRYIDTTGEHVEYKYIYTIMPSRGGKPIYKDVEEDKERKYVIVLGKEKKDVSANDLHKYLGFKDFEVVEKGDTLYYVVGEYDNAEDAVLAKENLEKKGVKVESISRTSDASDNVVALSENSVDRISDQLEKENKTYDGEEQGGKLFRVQIGAFSKKINEDQFFKNIPDLVYAKGADGLYRYYSGTFDNMKEAAKRKAQLLSKGLEQAFIVGYQNGERVTLKEAGVEVTENYDEEEEKETFVPNESLKEDEEEDQKECFYRVKVGEFKGEVPVETIDLYLSIGKIYPKKLEDGTVIYFSERFNTIEEAEKKLNKLKEDIESPSIIVEYENKFLTLEEAKDLINN